MQGRASTGVVRVTHSRSEVELATATALEKKREGYSPEALVMAVDEVLHNLQLSRAIVLYAQSAGEEEAEGPNVERPFSGFAVVMSLAFAAGCLWVVYLLFRMVHPDTTFLGVIGIVIGQAILLRLAQRGCRLAVMSAGDGLNDASYPTKLHPLRNSGSLIGSLRLRRLRALVIDSADRIRAGERPDEIERELADLNLTPRAAAFVVRQARIHDAVRDFLPPFENRWLGLSLALVFIVTCIVFIERSRQQLAEGYRNYAIGVTGWIAGDIGARPRRTRREEPPPIEDRDLS